MGWFTRGLNIQVSVPEENKIPHTGGNCGSRSGVDDDTKGTLLNRPPSAVRIIHTQEKQMPLENVNIAIFYNDKTV